MAQGNGAGQPESAIEDFEVAIVGTGFSGIAMAYYLERAGIDSFVLLEKADDVGGTWRENTYPGAACDVPSHLYSFSFEPKADWTHAFSPQPEIRDYLRHCARKYGVYEHGRFGAKVVGATFDEAAGKWIVRTGDGRSVRARSLVLGNGALHIPQLPDIPGRDTFEGASWHSAKWRHDYALEGKRVAVIGTGASSIQFVPQIAPRVSELHLFQRTPPWIVPRPDRAFSEREKAAFARSPALAKAYRALIYLELEVRAYGFVKNPGVLRLLQHLAKWHLRRSVRDPALREKLLPTYTMGCKRILLSNDYLPALALPNVELVTDPIAAIEPRGVRTRDGHLREVDAIVYGTGFNVSEYLVPIDLVGAGGRRLADASRSAPETYLGITAAGFPNLFLLMGPNTGLGHNSMIFMIEAQARYATQAVELLRARHARSLEVRRAVQDAFGVEVRERMKRTVWQTGGCHSWYQGADGHIPTLWPGFTVEYWMRTRKLNPADYELRA